MHSRNVSMTPKELIKLVEEYNLYQDEKSKSGERKREVRALSEAFGGLNKTNGIFVPSEDQKSFFSDLARGYTIEGLDLRQDPEFKDIGQQSQQNQINAVKQFIRRVWRQPDDKLINMLYESHLQGYLLGSFSLAILLSLKADDKSGYHFGRGKSFTVDYYQSEGETRTRSESWYHLYDQNEKLFDIPGRIICEYVLTAKGFRLRENYPLFSNTLLKILSLANENSIILSKEAIQLAEAEEKLRQICQDYRRWISVLQGPEADVIAKAFNVLDELANNLEQALKVNDVAYLIRETERLDKLTAALVQHRHITFTVAEYKDLLDDHHKKFLEYKTAKNEYETKLDVYLETHLGDKKAAEKAAEKANLFPPRYPEWRPLCMFADELKTDRGIFRRSPDQKENLVDDIYRNWNIEGKTFAGSPEGEALRQMQGEKKAAVKQFIMRELELKSDQVFDYLVQFHAQQLGGEIFFKALLNAGFVGPGEHQLNMTDNSFNYFKINGEIHLRVEQRFSRPGEEKTPIGSIQTEYVLVIPHGFKLLGDYPRFSSTVFKKLCLAEPEQFKLTAEAIALASAEENFLKIFNDPRLDFGSLTTPPEASTMPLARIALYELNENLLQALVANDVTYMKNQTAKFNQMANSLLLERLQIYVDDHRSTIIKADDKKNIPLDAIQKFIDAVSKRMKDGHASNETLAKVLTEAWKMIQDPSLAPKITEKFKSLKYLISRSVLQKSIDIGGQTKSMVRGAAGTLRNFSYAMFKKKSDVPASEEKAQSPSPPMDVEAKKDDAQGQKEADKTSAVTPDVKR